MRDNLSRHWLLEGPRHKREAFVKLTKVLKVMEMRNYIFGYCSCPRIIGIRRKHLNRTNTGGTKVGSCRMVVAKLPKREPLCKVHMRLMKQPQDEPKGNSLCTDLIGRAIVSRARANISLLADTLKRDGVGVINHSHLSLDIISDIRHQSLGAGKLSHRIS